MPSLTRNKLGPFYMSCGPVVTSSVALSVAGMRKLFCVLVPLFITAVSFTLKFRMSISLKVWKKVCGAWLQGESSQLGFVCAAYQ